MADRSADDLEQRQKNLQPSIPPRAELEEGPWWQRPIFGTARPAPEPAREPALPGHHGLKWVVRFFKFAGVMGTILLLRELMGIRDHAETETVTLKMIGHAIVTGAAASGFFQTVRMLRERRKTGAIMAAIGCALLIANSISPVVAALPIILSVLGLAVLASAWKKLD